MIRKISIIAAAMLAAAFFFNSCTFQKPVEVYKESFVDIQTAEPQYLYMQTMLPSEPKLIRWEQGYLMEKNALIPGAKWKKRLKFNPADFVIKKKDADGIKSIPVKYIEGWSQDKAGMYSAFTLKLGPSMNSSVAFYSFATGEIIYNQVVEDRPKDPPAMMSISIKDTYFGPQVSEDARFFALTRYNYLNESYIRVYQNGIWDKFEETENSAAACFASDTMYCRQYDRNTKKTYLLSREYGKKPKRLFEIRETLLAIKAVEGRVFLVTLKGVSEFNAVTNKSTEIFDFSQLRADADDFEIAEVYVSSDKAGPVMFFVNKKRQDNTYVWRLSARRL